MMQRISELKPALTKAFEALGAAVEDRGGSLLVRDRCVIDWRETTGPITTRFLEGWIAYFNEEAAPALVLMTMGHFSPKAIRGFLAKPKQRRRVLLIEMGLRNYFEERLEPRALSHEAHQEILTSVAAALESHDLELSVRRCQHCEQQVVVSCSVCGALLCKSHMIICPICRKHCCHTDVESVDRRCFHDHGCQS